MTLTGENRFLPPNLSQRFLNEVRDLWVKTNLTYDAETKDVAHKKAMRLLRHFARHVLNLPDEKFTVRSNKAGPAVSGEVTLHTEPFPDCPRGIYIMISQGSPNTILYRGCDGRNDYTGYRNNHAGMSDAFGSTKAMSDFAGYCKVLAQSTNPSRF